MSNKLEIGKMYYVSNENLESVKILIRKCCGIINGEQLFGYKYAVSVEPEEPEYVDVEVDKVLPSNFNFVVVCPVCNSQLILHECISHNCFAGYVFENDNINYQHCRNKNGKVCKSIRFKKES